MLSQRSNIQMLFCLAIFGFSLTATAELKAADIVVGVNNQNRIQYDIGRALCRVISKSIQGITCEPRRIVAGDAPGPLAVMNDVGNGALELGIVPSDWVFHASTGSGPAKFFDAKYDNLKVLFNLYGESLGLIARRDSGIKSLDDLVGKRINIANPGSYERAMMEMIMAAKGWQRSDFSIAEELSVSEQALALCHNRIQAMIVSGSHPDANIAKILRVCDSRLVDLTGTEISKLVADNPYFYELGIGEETYAGQKSVKTFGLRILAVSSEDIETDLAESIVRAVVENNSMLSRLHPALRAVSPATLMGKQNVIPFHDGAISYFRNKGLM